MLQQLGDFRDELIHCLDQQGPIALWQGGESVFGEGAAAQLPRALAVLEHQARLDFLFKARPASSSGSIGLSKSGKAWRTSRGFFCQ